MKKTATISAILAVVGFMAVYVALCYMVPGWRIKLEAPAMVYFAASLRHMALLKGVFAMAAGLVLALALLFVFLFLAAQYESWLIPVAVILSLPIAGIGAYLGNWACGLENNIYFQIGLVMLVGLVAKNAILIVEFAKDEVEKGRDILTAVILAARLRFRPIVMTSLAFILGMLPLVFASGPGSASRQGIGTGVFFGMLVAITVGIVFVPLFFVWVYKLKEKWTTR